jgi:ketosteroid isomerase-like protein
VSSSVPDPQDSIAAYVDAAKRGDADALYAMLSEDGKKSLSRDAVRKIVAVDKAELAQRGKELASPTARVRSEAEVRYADGEAAALVVEDGDFRISAADALPAEAQTPTQALGQLRRVLARRSYAGLVRVLTKGSRESIESDLRTLVEGLEDPESLDVDVRGDRATVFVPGGHTILLRREDGAWHVENFGK